jgi:hypothetical protein
MAATKTVFASKAEERNYKNRSLQWGERYHTYHNLPFLRVFDTDDLWNCCDWDLKPIHLSDTQMWNLRKTSIVSITRSATLKDDSCLNLRRPDVA